MSELLATTKTDRSWFAELSCSSLLDALAEALSSAVQAPGSLLLRQDGEDSRAEIARLPERVHALRVAVQGSSLSRKPQLSLVQLGSDALG